MLCPEVSNFKILENSISYKRDSVFTDVFKNLNYAHSVLAFLPDCVRTPDDIKNCLVDDSEYYKLNSVTLDSFVDPNFIDNFIKRGKFYALSTGTRVDCDDCVCITPDGELFLSLTRESYQCSGLQGVVSHINQKSKSRYIVVVKLLQESFTKTKNYLRIKAGLKNLRKFDIIFQWVPPSVNICPSSPAKYFYDNKFQVASCSPKFNVNIGYSVPAFSCNFKCDDDIMGFVEWLGMVALGCEMENDGDSHKEYLSSYNMQKSSEVLGQIRTLSWQGFFEPEQVKKLAKSLQHYLKIEEKSWIALNVQGFSDSPIGWNKCENSYYINSNNSYIIIIKHDEIITVANRTSNKRLK